MAYYAFLNENNVVTEVIGGHDENELGIDWEDYYGSVRGQRCKRTSYNTAGGKHIDGGVPFRKNYAGLGFYYDENLDAFIPPQPYPSWTLDQESCLWQPPIPMPPEPGYEWNENTKEWVSVQS